MEELYTFNSQQLESLKVSQSRQTLGKYRKKILSFNIGAKASPDSKSVPKSQCENERIFLKQKQLKKVKFSLPIEKIMEKKLLEKNPNNNSDQPLLVRSKSKDDQYQQHLYTELRQNHINDPIQTRPLRQLAKRAYSVTQREQHQGKISPLNEIERNSKVQRKPQKSNSVKLTPKIMIPLSNRRLPEVFKSKFFEKHIQKMFHKQIEQSMPKIRAVCQREIPMKQNRLSLKEQVLIAKKRIIIQSKLMQKLNLLQEMI